MPQSGAFVLAPNHYSEIDPLVMGVAVWKLGRRAALPREGERSSRTRCSGWLLRTSGQIPVERDGGARATRRSARPSELVEKGRIVIIYPEGTLTRDPDLWPMRGKTGAVRIALERGIPVIPAAHWGTQAILPRYAQEAQPVPAQAHRRDHRRAASTSSQYRGKPLDQSTLLAATGELMDAITALLAELRGERAPAERWDPAKHGQKETGRFEG